MTKDQFYDSINLAPEVKKRIIRDIDKTVDALVETGIQLNPYYVWDRIACKSFEGVNLYLEEDTGKVHFHTYRHGIEQHGPQMMWSKEGFKLYQAILEFDPDMRDYFQARLCRNLNPSLYMPTDYEKEMGYVHDDSKKPNITLEKAYRIFHHQEVAKKYQDQVDRGLMGVEWKPLEDDPTRECRNASVFRGPSYYQERMKGTERILKSLLVDDGAVVYESYVNKVEDTLGFGETQHQTHLSSPGFQSHLITDDQGRLKSFRWDNDTLGISHAYHVFPDGTLRAERMERDGGIVWLRKRDTPEGAAKFIRNPEFSRKNDKKNQIRI